MADNLWLAHFQKGTAANRPTAPELTAGSFGLYKATDTGEVSMFEAGGSSWSTVGSMGATAISTSSAVAASGASVDGSTGAKDYTLAAPFAGAIKPIMISSTTTSTLARSFTLAAGNLQSTASSTYTVLTFTGPGQSALLVGQSTAKYTVMSNNGGTLS